jgi:hypothetical protein
LVGFFEQCHIISGLIIDDIKKGWRAGLGTKRFYILRHYFRGFLFDIQLGRINWYWEGKGILSGIYMEQ